MSRPAPSPAPLLGDDATLVRRCQAGDRSAFDLLVARHTRLAGAVALSVVTDYHAALDVVQESFVKALDGLPKLADPGAFRGWLRSLVRTTALDFRRRQRVTGRAAEALPEQDEDGAGSPVPAPGLRPDELLVRAELREEVRSEIAGLPESQREVVLLKYLEGLSYEEIGELTGLSVGTIESRLFRARTTLRERLVARFGAAGARKE